MLAGLSPEYPAIVRPRFGGRVIDKSGEAERQARIVALRQFAIVGTNTGTISCRAIGIINFRLSILRAQSNIAEFQKNIQFWEEV